MAAVYLYRVWRDDLQRSDIGRQAGTSKPSSEAVRGGRAPVRGIITTSAPQMVSACVLAPGLTMS